MATLPPQGQSDFTKTPQEIAVYNAACPKSGSYMARIYKYVHVGTKKEDEFGKNGIKTGNTVWKNKLTLGFEILNYPTFIFNPEKGPQPWSCWKEDTFSTGENSNVFKYIKNIFRGDPRVMEAVVNGRFDISNLVNKLVMIETVQGITQGGKNIGMAKIKITNITAPPELPGYDLRPLAEQPLSNEFVVFDIDDFIARNPKDVEAFKKLHKFEQKTISETAEFVKAGLRLEDFQDQNTATPQYGYQANQQQGFRQPQANQNYQQSVQQSMYPPQQGYVPPKVEDDLPF